MAMPAAAAEIGARRVAVVCPPGAPLQQLRDMLVGDVISRSHRVLVVAPEFSYADVRALNQLGAEHAVYAPDGNGLKLFADWKAIGSLKQVLADWSPSIVVAYGSKTMVYGALAAKSAGAERIVLVVDTLPEQRFTGALGADEMPAWRYGQALRAADEAVFHNRDDLALLKKLALVPDNLAGYRCPRRWRRYRRPGAAAAAGAGPGPRLSDDRRLRGASRRHGILCGRNPVAPTRADLALSLRWAARRGLGCHRCP